MTSPGRVLFSQTRVGKGGRTFALYKFRTMVPGAEKLGSTVTSGKDPRITPLGKLLRRTKIDEIPQLWNVVRGEMSLVGPRPEVPEVVAKYTSKMRQILSVNPGITSVASLELHREEELLDLTANPDDAYLRIFVPTKVASAMNVALNPSFVQDLQILASTAWVLTLGRMFKHQDNELDTLIRRALEEYNRDRPDISGKQLLDSWCELPDPIRNQILQREWEEASTNKAAKGLKLASYEIILPDNPDLWRRVLPVDRSVFGSLEFARITEKSTAFKPRLFVFSDEDCQVAYPFFLRGIEDLPFALETDGRLSDIQTPDYSGPMLLEGRVPENPAAFARCFHEYCVAEGIVAEFARLHPWRAALELYDPTQVFLNREIVYVDLTQSLEDIWTKSLSRRCRGGIRKAERSDIEIIEGSSPTAINDFYRIYTDTMRRHDAAEKYCYPLSYFQSFLTELPLNSRFVLAEHQGNVVACSLYVFDKDDLYAYLGGLDVKYQELRPRNALTYEMIKWGKANGKKRLILGGGYRAEDGVFRHKASFSSLRASFCVYKQVHIPEAYLRLCNQSHVSGVAENEGTDFFPAYRISEEKSGRTGAF